MCGGIAAGGKRLGETLMVADTHPKAGRAESFRRLSNRSSLGVGIHVAIKLRKKGERFNNGARSRFKASASCLYNTLAQCWEAPGGEARLHFILENFFEPIQAANAGHQSAEREYGILQQRLVYWVRCTTKPSVFDSETSL